mgnify:FL=1
MRSLALDPVTGDLAVSGGRLALVSGVEAVRQRLKTRLSLWRGEWVLDRTVGVPYLTQVLGKIPRSTVEAVLRSVITTCPGVARLDTFALTVDEASREARLTVSVTTTDGGSTGLADFAVGQ